jgi:hypothetical protein
MRPFSSCVGLSSSSIIYTHSLLHSSYMFLWENSYGASVGSSCVICVSISSLYQFYVSYTSIWVQSTIKRRVSYFPPWKTAPKPPCAIQRSYQLSRGQRHSQRSAAFQSVPPSVGRLCAGTAYHRALPVRSLAPLLLCIIQPSCTNDKRFISVAYPGFFRGGLLQDFFSEGGSTNSVEDRRQREGGSGGGSPLVRGSTQFANEWNAYTDLVVSDLYSTEVGIRLSCGKTSEFRGGGGEPPQTSPRYANALHST